MLCCVSLKGMDAATKRIQKAGQSYNKKSTKDVFGCITEALEAVFALFSASSFNEVQWCYLYFWNNVLYKVNYY